MSSSGSHQVDVGNESQQSVIKIDPDGDLTLVGGRTKTRFLVCSKALSRSAPFWKRCLYGPFKEAKPAAGQKWVVEFPEDNPSALKCLLLLVHGLGHEMPQITLQLAFEIAVLTDKYNMKRTLWAVAKAWLDDLRPDEYDDDAVVPQIQWLWVMKVLGYSDQLNEAFAKLSQTVSMSTDGNGHLLLRIYETDDSDTLTRDNLAGYDAEKDVIFLLAAKIKAAREKALYQIQNFLKEEIMEFQYAIESFDSSNPYNGPFFCKGRKHDGSMWRPDERMLCEYAMQGIVNKMSAGKDSPLKPLKMISMSVEDFLASAARFISCIKKEIVLVCGPDHQMCTPFRTHLPFLGGLIWGYPHFQWMDNAVTLKGQVRVSGLGGGALSPRSATRKRCRDEFEGTVSE
ncbi:hypothetical protein SLS63_009036 [Diaporthe eres]|uniref:BTB domain-containing protein n=1 Tax=Diaporthe eres TaxID=83184 RepID=A0ABR1P0Q2_DIAER